MLVIYSNAYGLYAGNYSDAFGFNAWFLKEKVLDMALLQNGFKTALMVCVLSFPH